LKAKLRNKLLEYSPFIVLFAFWLWVHAFINPVTGDDAAQAYIKYMGIKARMILVRNSWGAREVTYGLGVLVWRLGVNFWRVVDSLCLTFLPMAASYFFFGEKRGRERNRLNWVICALFLGYPVEVLKDAGYIATTLAYLWVIVAALISMLPWRKIIRGEAFSKWEKVLLIIPLAGTVYGVDEEQGWALLLGGTICVILYIYRWKKRISVYMLLQLALCILKGVDYATAPGQGERTTSETQTWMPGFETQSTLEKLYNGTCDLFWQIWTHKSGLIFIFLVLLLLTAWKKYGQSYIMVFPVVMMGLYVALGNTGLTEFFSGLSGVARTGSQLSESTDTGLGVNSILVLYAVITFVLLILCREIFENKFNANLTCLILLAGMASKEIMAFSPTLYASNKRPSSFMYVCFFFAGILIYRELMTKCSVIFLRRLNMLIFVVGIIEAADILLSF